MANLRKVGVQLVAGMAVVITSAGVTTWLMQSGILSNGVGSTQNATQPSPSPDTKDCKVIVRDPDPPINVRSSPIVAKDNIVGELRNGMALEVIDEQVGWVRISSPVKGWVAKNLTIQTCASEEKAKLLANEAGVQTLKKATERYHTGDLQTALELAKTIATDSPAYDPARAAIVQWERDWPEAEAKFSEATIALKERRFQDVLNMVETYPENRFWKEKLTPLVQAAIRQQPRPATTPTPTASIPVSAP